MAAVSTHMRTPVSMATPAAEGKKLEESLQSHHSQTTPLSPSPTKPQCVDREAHTTRLFTAPPRGSHHPTVHCTTQRLTPPDCSLHHPEAHTTRLFTAPPRGSHHLTVHCTTQRLTPPDCSLHHPEAHTTRLFTTPPRGSHHPTVLHTTHRFSTPPDCSPHHPQVPMSLHLYRRRLRVGKGILHLQPRARQSPPPSAALRCTLLYCDWWTAGQPSCDWCTSLGARLHESLPAVSDVCLGGFIL
ncbi:unnamed protein product [Arctogadus glacialis]